MAPFPATMLRRFCLSAIMASFGCSSVLARSAATPINVYDGFEGPSLSNLWNTISLVPSSVSIQTKIVRAGRSALRIDLHTHDMFWPGREGDADSERDELLEARPLTTRENRLYEFSWSMYLPRDFPIVPVRLVVAQWLEYCSDLHSACGNNSPVLAVRYIGGVLSITEDLNHQFIVLYHEKRDLRSHWLDLRFQVRFTPDANGVVCAWLNGAQVVNYNGPTANTPTAVSGYGRPSYYPFKMGLYRNVMPQPMTIYLDEYRKRQIP